MPKTRRGTPSERCIEELATLGLSEAMLDRLRYANAAGILGLTDAGS